MIRMLAIISIFICSSLCAQTVPSTPCPPVLPPSPSLYRWLEDPATEVKRVTEASVRLNDAIKNPEYLLNNWVE